MGKHAFRIIHYGNQIKAQEGRYQQGNSPKHTLENLKKMGKRRLVRKMRKEAIKTEGSSHVPESPPQTGVSTSRGSCRC
jgi:hypothetical protein